MDFSRQEYWSRLPFHSPGDLSDPGIKPRCPALQADSLPSEPPGIGKMSIPTNLKQVYNEIHAVILSRIDMNRQNGL